MGMLASKLLSIPVIIGKHLTVFNVITFLKPYISVWKEQQMVSYLWTYGELAVRTELGSPQAPGSRSNHQTTPALFLCSR